MKLTILGGGILIASLLIGSVPLLLLGNSRLICKREADGNGSCHLVNGSLMRGMIIVFLSLFGGIGLVAALISSIDL